MLKKTKLLIVFLSLFSALFYNWLFPNQFSGINFTIFISLFLGLVMFLAIYQKEKELNAWAFFLVIPILWYAVCVALYKSTFVHVVAPIASLILILIFLFWSGAVKISFIKIKRLLPPQILIFFSKFFTRALSPFGSLAKIQVKTIGKVFWAILILCPLVLIFVGLFGSADLVFREWMKNFFDWQVDSLTVWHFFRTIFLFLFLNGLFYAYLSAKRFSGPDKVILQTQTEEKNTDQVVPGIVLGVLNLIFISFISIQLMFLFGGHEVINKYNITYADYVHNGFYQMAFIAVLVLIIGYVVYRIEKNKKLTLSKFLTDLLILQTIIIAISAFKRMFLYQEAYGLTQLRFLVEHFIIYLAVILFVLFMVILARKHYSYFIKISFGISIVYLMFMTAFNMQGHIAKVNIDRYFNGTDSKVDIQYLHKLTVDIYPQVTRLLSAEDSDIRKQAEDWIYVKKLPYKYADNYMRTMTLSDFRFWSDMYKE